MAKKFDWKAFDTQLIARAWEDEAFKAALLSNPAAAVAEAGLTIPEEVEIRVVKKSPGIQVQEAPGVHYLILPAKPEQIEADEGELSEEELSLAAGGIGGGSTTATGSACTC